ncbi:MAG TPA: nitronate monooxygenase [Ktedonobacterales bacterium]|jgi:nitronate monooxygenase/enoyl-[acyl-carrier protein] reductase II
MKRTRFCELLGIDYPIIQASFGPWAVPELVAAVSNAGGLGSIGTALQSAEQVTQQIARVRQLTNRPFVVNHTLRPLNEEAFQATIEAKPRAISLALGAPGDLVKRAHAAGILFIQQVHTVQQARQAAERNVDVIIAQGSEAGGFGGVVSSLALLPQVVDAVSPIPVLAAGGIADGRGLAAALVLGAQGINIGTRFLASVEATISPQWKHSILSASSEDAVKVLFTSAVFPPPSPGGYDASPRVLRTPFVDEWNQRPEAARQEGPRLGKELLEAIQQGRAHELVPFTGQSAGMIHDLLPAADILRTIMAEAETSLRRAARLIQEP